MSLSAQVLISAIVHEQNAAGTGTALRVNQANHSIVLAGESSKVAWSGSGTLAAGGSVNIDLRALTDDRGTTVLSSAEFVYVKNTGTGTLVIGGASSNQWSGFPSLTLGAGCVFSASYADLAVTTSSKVAKIASGSGGTYEYEMLVIGVGT